MLRPLVNMDLPWNPAILEQRIARIHRMGQARPVRVINFVAKGTIEEGMLSVLAFKRSLSAGILDGGSGEISLGGSRLNRFMKDVENVTGSMGEGEAVTPAEEVGSIVAAADDDAGSAEDINADGNIRAGEIARTDGVGTPPRDTASDPWQALVQVGAQFVAALAAANDPKRSQGRGASLDRARSGHRRAKPQNAAAATGNRATTCQCTFCTRGRPARQDSVTTRSFANILDGGPRCSVMLNGLRLKRRSRAGLSTPR